MPKRLDSTYWYVSCPDGKDRVFHPYKARNLGENLTRGYIQVQEANLGFKILSVPGWVLDSDPSKFIVNPNTERANVLSEVTRRKFALSKSGYKTWKEHEDASNKERDALDAQFARMTAGNEPTIKLAKPASLKDTD